MQARFYVILSLIVLLRYDVTGHSNTASVSPVPTTQKVTEAEMTLLASTATTPAENPQVTSLTASSVASAVTSSSVTSFNTPRTTAAITVGSQGTDCSQPSDCAEGFVCRSNTCDCPVGYSYNPLSGICQNGCRVYGSGFSYQERWCVYGYNTRKYMGLGSAEKCAGLCVDAESFVCVSFEMDEDNCYLQEVSQLDVPTSTFVSLGNCDSYQRHCAAFE